MLFAPDENAVDDLQKVLESCSDPMAMRAAINIDLYGIYRRRGERVTFAEFARIHAQARADEEIAWIESH